jgi:chromosome segregation ATPase
MSDNDSNGSSDREQIEVLRAIWAEMKAVKSALESQGEATRRELGERIDRTNQGLAQTNERLDLLRQELKGDLGEVQRRRSESEMRLATATNELSADVRELSGLIADWRREHREDREELRQRVGRIEQHAGLAPAP